MKSHTILILLLIIAAVALLSFSRLFSAASETDAKKFFMEDLEQSYPDADVREIIYINRIGEGPGSYFVLKARVSMRMYTPCPERIEVEYHYPARNFLKRDEKIVQGCKVCIDSKPNCHVSYPEEAIIASHTYNGTKQVKDYLDSYPNAIPNALLLDYYNQIKNVWQVEWISKGAPYGIRIFISQQDNKVVNTEQFSAGS